MPQSGFTPILIYGSPTASNVPSASDLTTNADGVELALNYTDGKLFYKDNGGTVQVLATKATTSGIFANDITVHGLTVGLGGGAVASNTAVGESALAGANSGTGYNTSVGYFSLSANTTGQYNTAVGGASLSANNGNNNSAFGSGALQLNTSGANNTAIGFQTLNANLTGAQNVAVGSNSLNLTTVNDNTGVGYFSLSENTTGTSNTAIGSQALRNNTTASNNTAVGYQAGYSNTTGADCCFIGSQAGYSNTSSNGQTFIGYQAGYGSAQTGNAFNLAVGYQAGSGLTTGYQNTFVGNFQCGYNVTTGTYNTILGGYNGNQGGLDIRTASNYIVLSDGAGNPQGYYNPSIPAWNLAGGVQFPDASIQTTAAYSAAAITAEFAHSNSATSGYQKLPSGTIIQWGTVAVTSSSAIVFPITFPNSATSVIGSVNYGASSVPANPNICQFALGSNSGFTAYATASPSGGGAWYAGAADISWIAIGY
jgi:hypothetical protein